MDNERIEIGGPFEWTARQREVLDLLAAGRTNPEIAQRLGVTLWGAKWHVSEVITRLGVATRDEAADYWRHHQTYRRRAGRFLRALVPVALAPKLAATGLTLAGFAGAVAVMSSVVSDEPLPGPAVAGAVSAYDPAGPPPVFATPLGPIELISALNRGDFRRELYAFQSAYGICEAGGLTRYGPRGEREYLPSSTSQICPEASDGPGSNWFHGPVHLSLSIAPGAWIASGMAAPNVDRILVTTVDGDTWDMPLLKAPSSLQTDWSFFQVFLNHIDGTWSTARIEARDGAGQVLFEHDYLPVRTPGRQ